MGRFAFALSSEFPVALPNDPSITVGGVPGFCPENFAAVGTEDLPGKGTGLAVPGAAVFAPFQLHLNLLPFPGFDDGGVAVLHVVLGNLSLVDLGFLREKIHRERLLKQSRTLVLFVPQDALHGGPLPHGFLAGSGDSRLRQHGGNGVGGFSLEQLPVDAPDNFRFLRYDLRQSVGAFAVAEELSVGNADLAVREPFPLSPCDVFGDAAALFLRKARHNGDEQFPFGVEGHDIFFLEEAFTAGFFQSADGGQAVHGVPGEAADGLGDDKVDLPGKGIPDHTIETVPVLGVDGTDALVCVDLDEIPVRILPNKLGVVIHLCFVRGRCEEKKIHRIDSFLQKQGLHRKLMITLRYKAGNAIPGKASIFSDHVHLQLWVHLPMRETTSLESYAWPFNNILDCLEWTMPLQLWTYIAPQLSKLGLNVTEENYG